MRSTGLLRPRCLTLEITVPANCVLAATRISDCLWGYYDSISCRSRKYIGLIYVAQVSSAIGTSYPTVEDDISSWFAPWRWQFYSSLASYFQAFFLLSSCLILLTMAVAVDVADPLMDSFPDYVDPFEPFEIMTAFQPTPVNKAVSGVQASEPSSRYPSPQPSHLCLPHQARKATMGYVAPTFLEKPAQVKEGKNNSRLKSFPSLGC